MHQPTVVKADFHPIRTTPEFYFFSLALEVRNPNPVTLTFTQAKLKINMADRPVISKILTSVPLVPGYAHRVFELPVYLTYSQVWKNIPGSAKQGNLNISGMLYPSRTSEYSPLPFVITRELPIPLFLQTQLQAINPLENQQTVVIKMTVSNPNLFSITLMNISGQLEYQGNLYQIMPPTSSLKLASGQEEQLTLTALADEHPPVKQDLRLTGEIEGASDFGSLISPFVHTCLARENPVSQNPK